MLYQKCFSDVSDCAKYDLYNLFMTFIYACIYVRLFLHGKISKNWAWDYIFNFNSYLTVDIAVSLSRCTCVHWCSKKAIELELHSLHIYMYMIFIVFCGFYTVWKVEGKENLLILTGLVVCHFKFVSEILKICGFFYLFNFFNVITRNTPRNNPSTHNSLFSAKQN